MPVEESKQGPNPTLAGQWEPFDETGPYGAKGSSVYPLPKKYADGDEDNFPVFNPWPQTVDGIAVTSPAQLTVLWDGRSHVDRWPGLTADQIPEPEYLKQARARSRA